MIVVEQRDDGLIVQPLGTAHLEIDDEIDVLLAARDRQDLQAGAADERLQIFEDRRARARVDGDRSAARDAPACELAESW